MEAIIGAVFYDSAKNGDDLKRVLIALGLAWLPDVSMTRKYD
jgi:hypothetical protein